jgi:hypothetical protein
VKQTIDVKTIALNRAVTLLKSLGAQYKIIMPEGGGEYGALEVVAPGGAKKGTRYGHGALREHVMKFMSDMQIGDVVNVPWEALDVDSVQASIGGYAADTWGAGSIMSTRKTRGTYVEVMRVV